MFVEFQRKNHSRETQRHESVQCVAVGDVAIRGGNRGDGIGDEASERKYFKGGVC